MSNETPQLTQQADQTGILSSQSPTEVISGPKYTFEQLTTQATDLETVADAYPKAVAVLDAATSGGHQCDVDIATHIVETMNNRLPGVCADALAYLRTWLEVNQNTSGSLPDENKIAIIRALHSIGDDAGAQMVLENLTGVYDQTPDSKPYLDCLKADALISLGKIDEGISLISSLDTRKVHSRVIGLGDEKSKIVQHAVDRDHVTDEVIMLAATIADEYDSRNNALHYIARWQAENEHLPEALVTLSKMKWANSDARVSAEATLCAKNGNYELAISRVKSLKPKDSISAQISVALELGKLGEQGVLAMLLHESLDTIESMKETIGAEQALILRGEAALAYAKNNLLKEAKAIVEYDLHLMHAMQIPIESRDRVLTSALYVNVITGDNESLKVNYQSLSETVRAEFGYNASQVLVGLGKPEEAWNFARNFNKGLKEQIQEGASKKYLEAIAKQLDTVKVSELDADKLAACVTSGDRKIADSVARSLGTISLGADPAMFKTILDSASDEDRPRLQALYDNGRVRSVSETKDAERREILTRTVTNIRDAVSNPDNTQLTRVLLDTLLSLDSQNAREAILSVARSQSASLDQAVQNRNFMRVAKALVDANTIRGNELVLHIAAAEELDYHQTLYLLQKLADNKFIDGTIGTWLQYRRGQRPFSEKSEQEKADREDVLDLKEIITNLGVSPSKEVLEYLVGSDHVRTTLITPVSKVKERIAGLKVFEDSFNQATTPGALVEMLSDSPEKALAYYVLNVGKTHFDLVNNYSFSQFTEMLNLISYLEIAEGPLVEFERSLVLAGWSPLDARRTSIDLINGRNPFFSKGTPALERVVDLNLSENSQHNLARNEITDVLGPSQLGVCVKTPVYREYVQAEIARAGSQSEIAQKLQVWLGQLDASASLSERSELISELESVFPELVKAASLALKSRWSNVLDKLGISIPIDGVLGTEGLDIDPMYLLKGIELRRTSLQSSKAEVLNALRQENPQLARIDREVRSKRKAVEGLSRGLAENPNLAAKIDQIERDIVRLQEERELKGQQTVGSRFAHLSDDERAKMLSEESSELKAIGQKDPSAILISQILDLLGVDSVTEHDLQVIKEVRSHLQSPMQVMIDERQSGGSATKRANRQVRVRMLDKREDLMEMVRFADGKICCFASSNYHMRVAHDTENKEWIAAMNKDPMSFVFAIEDARENQPQGTVTMKNNIGFVFGMYGVSSDGQPVTMLNGVYLATGNDAKSVEAILSSIEGMLSQPIGAKYQLVASKYGGKIADVLPGYSDDVVTAKRLRAIRDGKGVAHNIYDDLGTQINKMTKFGKDSSVIAKRIEQNIAFAPSVAKQYAKWAISRLTTTRSPLKSSIAA